MWKKGVKERERVEIWKGGERCERIKEREERRCIESWCEKERNIAYIRINERAFYFSERGFLFFRGARWIGSRDFFNQTRLMTHRAALEEDFNLRRVSAPRGASRWLIFFIVTSSIKFKNVWVGEWKEEAIQKIATICGSCTLPNKVHVSFRVHDRTFTCIYYKVFFVIRIEALCQLVGTGWNIVRQNYTGVETF